MFTKNYGNKLKVGRGRPRTEREIKHKYFCKGCGKEIPIKDLFYNGRRRVYCKYGNCYKRSGNHRKFTDQKLRLQEQIIPGGCMERIPILVNVRPRFAIRWDYLR